MRIPPPPPLPLLPTMDRLPLPLPFSPDLLWRYPLSFPPRPGPPSSPGLDFKTQLPASLAQDPRLWSRDDVVLFLRWCEREFDLPTFDTEAFQMNGKALCLLTKSDLGERAPGSGDVVHNVLQLLRDINVTVSSNGQNMIGRVPGSPLTPPNRHSQSLPSLPPASSPAWTLLNGGDFHNLGHLIHQTNSVTLSPAPSIDSQSGSPQHPEAAVSHLPPFSSGHSGSGRSGSGQSDSEDSLGDSSTSPQRSPGPLLGHPQQQQQQQQGPVHNGQPPPLSPVAKEQLPPPLPRNDSGIGESPEPNTNGRLLWDFLQQLLNDPAQRYCNYIAWKNRDTGVFKIVDPAGLARLWGIQKNHLSMNYDKMSRALRYYYRVNILRKVQGERHCYQFLRNPTELKNIKNISLLRQQVNMCSRTPLKMEVPEIMAPEMTSESMAPESIVPEADDMPTDLSMETSERHTQIMSMVAKMTATPTSPNIDGMDHGMPTDLSLETSRITSSNHLIPLVSIKTEAE